MKPSRLVTEFAMLIEELCHPIYDRDTGDEQPVTRDQWAMISERFETLRVLNCPRISGRENER